MRSRSKYSSIHLDVNELKHSHVHTQTHPFTHTHTHTHTLYIYLSLTLTHSHARTHAHDHVHIHVHTHAHARTPWTLDFPIAMIGKVCSVVRACWLLRSLTVHLLCVGISVYESGVTPAFLRACASHHARLYYSLLLLLFDP